jgi:uncharacterized protein (DUF1778 family)
MKSKDQQLQIRVTPAEKAAIKVAAARAGMDMSAWMLARVLPPARATFQQLVAALAETDDERRYGLADLNDFLTSAAPRELEQAVADPPAVQLDPYVSNYVAAMVETAATRAGMPPPAWTAKIAGLETPVFGTLLDGLRLHLLLYSPPAFRRRNIFIDATIGDRV